MEQLKLQVIGFGPAALGLFVAADRNGQLDALLDGRLCIHERAPSLADWDGLGYAIDANSPVRDFLAGIRPDGIFGACLCQPRIRHWLEQGEQIVALHEISAFLKTLATVLVELSGRRKELSIRWGSAVESVRRHGSVFLADGDVASRYLVLACGSTPRALPGAGPRLLPPPAISADCLLRAGADAAIGAAIVEGRPILVLGGSHGGFSSLCYLLERFGAALPPAALHLYSKQPVALWSGAPGTTLAPWDVIDCHTGEVNKFTGLRGAAQTMFLRAHAGAEPRVVLHIGPQSPFPEALGRAGALLINATGYQARLPLLLDQDGVPIVLDQDNGNIGKCPATHALTRQGVPVEGLYGLGLGFADRRGSAFEVGVNFFHGASADNILGALAAHSHS